MKIGIDIRTLMDKNYSGVSEYTLNLVREILKKDCENEYILFYNSFRNVDDRIPRFEGNYKIVKTRYPNKLFNFILQMIFKYPKLDKMLGVEVFLAPNIGFYALSKNCKKILTIHDLAFMRYPEFFSWKRRLWHRLVNAKKLIKQFDKIIAVSENTKMDVVELSGISEDKVKIIYSGVDSHSQIFNFQFSIFNKFQNQNDKFRNGGVDSVRKKYNLPDKYILYLGTVEPRKNIVGLIKAYNLYRSHLSTVNCQKLVVAGAWGWKTGDIRREWQASPYKNDIKFLDYIDKTDKYVVYYLSEIFVFPSFYEGFGLPVLEAMSVGVPVITSFVSSLPEVAGESAIMVDPNNIYDLAEAIKLVALNQDLRDNLIRQGCEQVKKFSWEKTAQEYLKFFYSIR